MRIKNNIITKKASGYAAIIVFLFLLAFLFYLIDEIYIERSLADKFEFKIEKGETLNSVISRLDTTGLIRNEFIVKSYLFLSGFNDSIKPGLYAVGPKYSVRDLFAWFARGADAEVKVFEGWTSKEIGRVLEEQGVVKDSEEFFKLAKNFDNSGAEHRFLPAQKGIDLEGYLFPDTYRFERGSAVAAIEKMLDNFDKKVFSRYRNTPIEELRNIMIMASLLEKEVRTAEDMRLVSGVLWKRFESGVSLQVDATLVYLKCVLILDPGVEDGACRQISNGDKELDSSYNTYLYKGLPPGPISNPGLKAVEAAKNPAESRYWYYLSAKADGRTVFSETLDEHNANRLIYR